VASAATAKDAVRRNLRLSSPSAHGADVAHLQRSLNGRLKARHKNLIKVDGVYGRSTANAVRDVLWFLGAPSTWLDHGATREAQRIIRRPNGRDDEWKARARERKRTVAKHEDAVDKLVAWAYAQVGKHEEGDNRGAYVDHLEADFHMQGQPWCGAFVGWGLRHVAGVAVPDGIVYTPNILGWARAGTNGFKVLARPQKGCLVLFDFGSSPDPVEHVGLYVGNGETVEGNTHVDPGGSQNNGGQVCKKKRGRGPVVAYIGIHGLHF
jgi:hypothetical protein